jgi:hypothetical protein
MMLARCCELISWQIDWLTGATVDISESTTVREYERLQQRTDCS